MRIHLHITVKKLLIQRILNLYTAPKFGLHMQQAVIARLFKAPSVLIGQLLEASLFFTLNVSF